MNVFKELLKGHGRSLVQLKRQRKYLLSLMIALMFSYQTVLAQQLVSINVKNATLKSVLNTIKEQTGFGLVFTRSVLKNTLPVTLSVRNQPLDAVLALCFKGQPVNYRIIKGSIIVTKKDAELPKAPALPVGNVSDADTGTLSGQVFDAGNGTVLPGITVLDKVSGKGAVSDEQGKYLLKGISLSAAVLQFRSIGYEMQEIKPDGRTSLSIQLKPLSKGLDETVVIAYGTTTRRMNTGSISKVSSKQIETQPISNPILALQGRVPGLDISQFNGLPGSNLNVMIRGRNSIQQGTDPLYIVNGVPFISDNISQISGLYANSPFNTINPDDIESIEVLKDADATAIYGSRGANGVILITTKSGKSGKTTVDVNFQSGWGQVTRNYDMMNTEQYLAMRREAFKNDGVTPTASAAPDLLRFDTTRYIDWSKVLIGNTAHTTNGNIRLTAGDTYTNLTLGAGYYRESSVFPGDAADRKVNVDLSARHRSKDGDFNVSFFANYADENNELPYTSLASSVNTIPNNPWVYDKDGNLSFSENGTTFTNPFAKLRQPYNSIADRLSSNGTISYRLFSKLTLKADFGYNVSDYNERTKLPIASQNPAINPVGYANFAQNQVKSWLIEPQLEYNSSISKKDKLQLLLGASWQQSKQNGYVTSASGYTNDEFLDYLSIAVAPSVTTTNSATNYRYNAFFGRINYSYDNKYVVNLTGRRDGSSRFGSNRQFANFGAVGASWIFTSESWITDNIKFLSFGKLRGSYGITGNDQIDNYRYLDTWQATQYAYDSENSLQPSRLYNNDFSWEKNTKTDLAVELGFLKDRILLTADWYRNLSSDQLIDYRLPGQTGFGSILRNFPGKVKNTGWEFELNTINIKTKSWSWNSSFNLTIPKNELVSFPGLENSTYSDIYVIGQPLGVIKGLHYLGVDPQTGVYTFEDKNGDGLFNSSDYRLIGTIQKQWYGGLLNSFTYKGFTLDFLVQFVKQTGRSAVFTSSLVGVRGNVLELYEDHWKQEGDKTTYQKFSQKTGGPASAAALNISNSDAMLTDASYLRLKNVSLSYILPAHITSKMKIERLRIFTQAQNLLTLTNYIGGDPEGQNRLQLPPLTMITAGVQVTF